MSYLGIVPIHMFCPNCGRKLTGYKGEDGAVRMNCQQCKSVIFSKQRSVRETHLKIIATKEA
jgi:NTP pyrophosphohydrolases containing a Zn-finger, probably nucleic-acid-binding